MVLLARPGYVLASAGVLIALPKPQPAPSTAEPSLAVENLGSHGTPRALKNFCSLPGALTRLRSQPDFEQPPHPHEMKLQGIGRSLFLKKHG